MTHRCGSHGFSHEVLFYAGLAEFTQRTSAFVREGLHAGEPVLVMVGPPKLAALREALGSEADGVSLVDMEVVGRNPACIIPAWREFFAAQPAGGPPPRGIGEPIWRGRSAAELLECQLHESLINLAFASGRGRLLCPYDSDALEPSVIAEARRGHPLIAEQPGVHANAACEDSSWLDARFQAPLPELARAHVTLRFDVDTVAEIRKVVAASAIASGLESKRAFDAALATHELAANSIRHGGGHGTLRVWSDGGALVCEVGDAGAISDPLAGRHLPERDSDGGRGLWMVNHLTDLSQIRTGTAGTTVRLTINP